MNKDKIRCSVYYQGQHIAEFRNLYLFSHWWHRSKYFYKNIHAVVIGRNHVAYKITDK